MRYGSVCSGIEAAHVAFQPLGWTPAWLSEIDPFACAVLQHHLPKVPNLGDMTRLPARMLAGELEAPDVLVGGTPCQAFSVAGLRQSLDDPRGNLALAYCELLEAIDVRRRQRNEPAAIALWENVPGVLTTKDNAFGHLLAGLAGESVPLEPPGGRWTDAGVVLGPSRAVAWRVLDAQYFGLAQRRKRVFVVASARPDFDPTAVLLEWSSVRRDSAPSREARETATTLASRSSAGGLGTDAELDGGLTVSPPVTAKWAKGSGGPAGDEVQNLIAFDTTQITHPANFSNPKPGDPCHALPRDGHPPAIGFNWQNAGGYGNANEGLGLTEDGVGPILRKSYPAVAFSSKDYGADVSYDLSPTLRAMNWNHSHANGGGQVSVLTLSARGRAGGVNLEVRADGTANALLTPSGGRSGLGIGAVAHTLSTRRGATEDGTGRGTPLVLASAAVVRRLTPRECERLQGFPDDWTLVPYRGKPAADTPRYRAIGNSWAVPVVRWIGQRIAQQLRPPHRTDAVALGQLVVDAYRQGLRLEQYAELVCHRAELWRRLSP